MSDRANSDDRVLSTSGSDLSISSKSTTTWADEEIDGQNGDHMEAQKSKGGKPDLQKRRKKSRKPVHADSTNGDAHPQGRDNSVRVHMNKLFNQFALSHKEITTLIIRTFEEQEERINESQQSYQTQQEQLLKDKSQLEMDRKILQSDREQLSKEKDQFTEEKDQLTKERELLRKEKQELEQERADLIKLKNSLTQGQQPSSPPPTNIVPNELCSPTLSFELFEPTFFQVGRDSPIMCHYTRNLQEMNNMIEESDLTRSKTMISLGICWNESNKTSLITISNAKSVYLFHIVDCAKRSKPLPPLLSKLLTNKDIIKTGLDIVTCIDKLFYDYQNIYVSPVFNHHKLLDRSVGRNLNSIVRKVFDKDVRDLIPTPQVSRSDWETNGLTREQMMYEVKSAYIGYRIVADLFGEYRRKELEKIKKDNSAQQQVRGLYQWIESYKLTF
ncbi:WRNexo [Acrasis kona]|uniref:WRNexo n=1 Tax=Acrasis kona TaxID=1008807 RepID=A0AAW2ZPB0_9EUKA